jgi:hypothetical protein
MAALKIPKAFLGYEENLEGKAVLAAEDVRFARTIERIQKIFESEFNKLAIIHLYLQGYNDHSLIDFELTLNNPSIVYERQKVEVLNEKMTLINLMRDTNMVSRKYIYENILGLSLDEWLQEEDLLINDKIKEWALQDAQNSGRDPFMGGSSEESEEDIEGFGGDDNFGGGSDFGDGGGFGEEPTTPEAEPVASEPAAAAPEAETPVKEEGTNPKNKRKYKFTPKSKIFGRDPLGASSINKGLDLSAKDLENLRAKYKMPKIQRLTELLSPDND